MKIHIDDSRTISAIQKEFNDAFTYLKIEFFKKKHGVGEVSSKADMLPEDATLAKWRTAHTKGDLEVTETMTVQQLETAFQQKFGVSAQVFRKSGDVWLETTVTDSWTLKEQNEQGEFMEKDVGE